MARETRPATSWSHKYFSLRYRLEWYSVTDDVSPDRPNPLISTNSALSMDSFMIQGRTKEQMASDLVHADLLRMKTRNGMA